MSNQGLGGRGDGRSDGRGRGQAGRGRYAGRGQYRNGDRGYVANPPQMEVLTKELPKLEYNTNGSAEGARKFLEALNAYAMIHYVEGLSNICTMDSDAEYPRKTLVDAPQEQAPWNERYLWQENAKTFARFERELTEDKIKLAGVIIGNMGNTSKDRLNSTELGRASLISKDPREIIRSIVATHLAGGVSQAPERVFYHALTSYNNIRMGEEETLPYYHERFKGCVSALKLAATAANEENNVPSDRIQLQHFIERMNVHYGDFKDNYRRGFIQ